MRIFSIHIHSHSCIFVVIATGTNHKSSLHTCITKHSHWNTPTFLGTRPSSQLRVPQTPPLSTAYVYWLVFFSPRHATFLSIQSASNWAIIYYICVLTCFLFPPGHATFFPIKKASKSAIISCIHVLTRHATFLSLLNPNFRIPQTLPLSKLPMNRFVCTTRNSTKCVVDWIPLRIRGRSRNTQPQLQDTSNSAIIYCIRVLTRFLFFPRHATILSIQRASKSAIISCIHVLTRRATFVSIKGASN